MFRVDAQHSYAPPAQGPEWYGKILARNKFEGSVYVPHAGSLEDVASEDAIDAPPSLLL